MKWLNSYETVYWEFESLLSLHVLKFESSYEFESSWVVKTWRAVKRELNRSRTITSLKACAELWPRWYEDTFFHELVDEMVVLDEQRWLKSTFTDLRCIYWSHACCLNVGSGESDTQRTRRACNDTFKLNKEMRYISLESWMIQLIGSMLPGLSVMIRAADHTRWSGIIHANNHMIILN